MFAASVLLLIVALTSTASALEYRLSTIVIPAAYNITIKPYLLPEDGDKRFTFDGEVLINLHAVAANVREITLHKDYIDITSCTLFNSALQLVQTVSENDLSYESETDKLTVKLQSALTVNANYSLHFVYTGQIRNGLAGFFRSSYIDNSGAEKWIGVTQMQRIDARTVFPCFDEPGMKATFQLHINRPKQYSAKFNTQITRTEDVSSDRALDHFEESPIMSTYLVAFLVTEFGTRGEDDLTLSIRTEYLNKTDYSFEVAQRALAAYNNLTNLTYKSLGNAIMQKAGVPAFPHNGMENWGLVIYKDNVLVHEPGYTDGWTDKEYTLTIIVHETAHMWFGNSVTFAWWSYFWLNEAFARYYQYFLAHELNPEFELDQQFVVNQVHLIFATDAVNTTQPMTSPESEVETPSQIAKQFSSIAYAKGASIVRMIHNLMGPHNFNNAIRAYLQENHLGSVAPADFFVHLKRHWPSEQQVDLDQFFYDWTEQVGYPALHVSLSSDGRTINVAQQRFLLNFADGSDTQLRYTVPITFTTDAERKFGDLTPKSYFNRSAETWSWQADKSIKWLIMNLQQSNFHRIYYETSLLNAINIALMEPEHSNIHVINRANLVDDLFNFALVNMIDYAKVLSFLEYLSTETEYLPWYAAFKGLKRVADRLPVMDQEKFSQYLIDITQSVYAKLGFERDNDTVLDVYNRNRVVGWLCKYRHTDCNSQAREFFSNGQESGKKPSPDFRKTVYCSAVRFGDYKYYNTLDQWYKLETLASEKELLLSAMGCTFHFAETHYVRILTNEIPLQYKTITLTPLYAENPENVTPIFKMITLTISGLANALGSWANAASVVSDIAGYFTTLEQKSLLEDFIIQKGDLFGTSISTLNAAVVKVETNLIWANEHLEGAKEYLYTRGAASTIFSASGQFMLSVAILYLLLSYM